MMRKTSFQDELINDMHQLLINTADHKDNVSVSKAVDYLNNAIDIFEEAGMNVQADNILNILSKIAEEGVWKDQIPGGLADKKKPEDFDPEALAKGIQVELEHTDDINIATEIAMDHLKEDPKYYDKLEIMENE